MPVRNVDLILDYGDTLTELSLGAYVVSLEVNDGRRVGQWHDNPGRLTANLRVTDGLITPDNVSSYIGRSVTARGGSVT